MVDEGFGVGAAAFKATEALHGDVPFFQDSINALAYVAVAGLVLQFNHGADVHPVCWMEKLALCASHRLKVI